MRGAHRPPATTSFLPSVSNPSANASPDQAPMDYPDDGDQESHHAQKVAEPVLAYDVLNNVVLPERPDGSKQPERLEEPNAVSQPGAQCDQPNRYAEGGKENPRAAVGGLRQNNHSSHHFDTLDPSAPQLVRRPMFRARRSWRNDGKCRQNNGVPRARAHHHLATRSACQPQTRLPCPADA